MKRVINGKVYDTETATELHNYCNGLGTSDFRNLDESLYQTPKGAYFLAGSGGAMSKYAQPCGDMTGGGEGIEPITEAEAMEWLETHDGDKVLLERFKDKIEEA